MWKTIKSHFSSVVVIVTNCILNDNVIPHENTISPFFINKLWKTILLWLYFIKMWSAAAQKLYPGHLTLKGKLHYYICVIISLTTMSKIYPQVDQQIFVILFKNNIIWVFFISVWIALWSVFSILIYFSTCTWSEMFFLLATWSFSITNYSKSHDIHNTPNLFPSLLSLVFACSTCTNRVGMLQMTLWKVSHLVGYRIHFLWWHLP